MKRFILCISCLLICCLFLLPEVQAAIPDTGNWISHHLLASDGLTVLAAGPAFAPLKWNIGQNNMGGYKGRLLFIPYDAPSTVPLQDHSLFQAAEPILSRFTCIPQKGK